MRVVHFHTVMLGLNGRAESVYCGGVHRFVARLILSSTASVWSWIDSGRLSAPAVRRTVLSPRARLRPACGLRVLRHCYRCDRMIGTVAQTLRRKQMISEKIISLSSTYRRRGQVTRSEPIDSIVSVQFCVCQQPACGFVRCSVGSDRSGDVTSRLSPSATLTSVWRPPSSPSQW